MKSLFFGVLVSLFTSSALALPDATIHRLYYSDASYSVLVGELWIGCTAGSTYFKGETTSYSKTDPTSHGMDCTWMGNFEDAAVGSCFTSNSFVYTDEDGDGYVDGYTGLNNCVNGSVL